MNPNQQHSISTRTRSHRMRGRRSGLVFRGRGFNIPELLIALAISAALLASLMVAIDASYRAYQSTTRSASTHIVGRLIMDRMLTLIRTGQEFGPFPLDPRDSLVESDFIQFLDANNVLMELRWDDTDNGLYITVDSNSDGILVGENNYLLLSGVIPMYDPPTSNLDEDRIRPFILEYQQGRNLYRASINLSVIPDDNMSVAIEGNSQDVLRLIGSAMPRLTAFDS